jgi:hypothetical protein
MEDNLTFLAWLYRDCQYDMSIWYFCILQDAIKESKLSINNINNILYEACLNMYVNKHKNLCWY